MILILQKTMGSPTSRTGA